MNPLHLHTHDALAHRIDHLSHAVANRPGANGDWERTTEDGARERGEYDAEYAVHQMIRAFFDTPARGSIQLEQLIREKDAQLRLLEQTCERFDARARHVAVLYPADAPVDTSLAYARGYRRGELRALENWHDWMNAHYLPALLGSGHIHRNDAERP